MKVLVLAGGSGTRLWPASREAYPKQFLKLGSEKSLLQQTLERLLNIVSPKDILLLTNEQYEFLVLSDVNEVSKDLADNILLEPARRNTAPAIALGMKYCLERLRTSSKEVLFVCPSDHIIKPVEKFVEYVKLAEKVARQGYIVAFGIKPLHPETGYGYIKITGEDHGGYYLVERFTEKPNLETAKRFLSEGNYFWNSGMFVFTIETMIEELRLYASEIYQLFNQPLEDMIANFQKMPDISIDYAVMEKSKKVAAIPMDIYWSDIGSWDSLYDALDKDEKSNVIFGNVLVKDIEGCLVIGNKRLIATVDLKDLIIVETDDAVLIAKRGSAQKVKHVVEELKRERQIEVFEHRTAYRPWGECTILEDHPGYKIKRIVVKPGASIDPHIHHHCSKHWIVVKGTAKVTIGNKVMYIHENESVYVPKSTLHRLENPDKIPLEIIEVQNSECAEENME
ncbi:MAG: mannose-1-phosphate guanylyltransferase/mannose-6-phosphate isomerase [Caldimicrobium sp.]|nr:mannose-1-phosphate guanylyltransferase/mannose-6-phosphate isomerase [Caldimicrobium sp.]